MKPTVLLTLLLSVSSVAHADPKTIAKPASKVPYAPSLTIAAQQGAIRITPIFHGSLQIEYRGKVIHVDPFSQGDYSRTKKADVVLITHAHPDHLDGKALARLLKDNGSTIIFASDEAHEVLDEAMAEGRMLTNFVMPVQNGKSFYRDGPFHAVAAYNVKRGPKPGQKFHPKGVGNGYVLNMGGKRIYIAGDTEFVPEMKELKKIDVAFLPMNLPYTMTPQEAAQAAKSFKPKMVVPYHYRYPFDKRNKNPQQFTAALKGTGIQVKLLKWYANE